MIESTAPTQTPNPPVSTAPSTAFAISVGLSPNSVVFGEPTVVRVTIVARRTDTGEVVPRYPDAEPVPRTGEAMRRTVASKTSPGATDSVHVAVAGAGR